MLMTAFCAGVSPVMYVLRLPDVANAGTAISSATSTAAADPWRTMRDRTLTPRPRYSARGAGRQTTTAGLTCVRRDRRGWAPSWRSVQRRRPCPTLFLEENVNHLVVARRAARLPGRAALVVLAACLLSTALSVPAALADGPGVGTPWVVVRRRLVHLR